MMLPVNKIKLIRLAPANYVHNVWGGSWIPRLKGRRAPGYPVGESWEFSAHPAHPSRVVGAGKRSLAVVLKTPKIPFLVKLIDAQKNLSLQVHPNNAYARAHEHDSGKAESWVILDASRKKNEGFIYLGFKSTKKLNINKFLGVVREGHSKKILSFLNKIRVRPGDVYDLPPGTVHAIGRGVRLYEIQQTSNVTYRIWDWNRPDPKGARPLHLKKALDVLKLHIRSKELTAGSKILHKGWKAVESRLLLRPQYGYAVNRIQFSARKALLNQGDSKRFYVLTVVKGWAVFSLGAGKKSSLISQGETVVIPKGLAKYSLESGAAESIILKCFIP